MRPYNEARECLFQTDGQMNACFKYMHEYSYCQNNPEETYKRFLEAATPAQKKSLRMNTSVYYGINESAI